MGLRDLLRRRAGACTNGPEDAGRGGFVNRYPHQMSRSGRYCRVLRDDSPDAWDSDAIVGASNALEREMALVPAGSTVVEPIASWGSSAATCPAVDV